ncbi:VQ motif-containing protein 10-like [Magnolia sinica]|uniref:VQ motif-containing protein 10-like n=1 Tax=Magnolia sinica TaxID=86752 RepID=UPI0026595F0E|nr:VQ motif-containing protein 10-like [Magnolia sinica]
MSIDGRDIVKVRIIVTQYIETDVMSFKSVVQSLTGRDSNAPQPLMAATTVSSDPSERKPSQDGEDGSWSTKQGNLQLEEFEKMLLESPSLDELLGLLSD